MIHSYHRGYHVGTAYTYFFLFINFVVKLYTSENNGSANVFLICKIKCFVKHILIYSNLFFKLFEKFDFI